ncbi:uncharacterized protein LOC123541570 [Mercenaria mercenaria]|uniref:uncharacterized protein LOC123541570 n=1 Tax=Mercenaria mercenaria TaxID=6596 RepID=UPI00234EBE62|nr:uncharacterized protein LOC123541570 [Mercenaria mercenaria]
MENESRTTNDTDFSKKTWKEDVALLVEGKKLHVAKNVLSYTSPVFDAMFSSPFSEKDKAEVELPGKEFKSFLEFLRCIYPGSKGSITEENVFQLLSLADEYQVEKLKKKCTKFLCQYVGKETRTTQDVLKCLAVSERYQLNGIKAICVDTLNSKDPIELIDVEIDPLNKDTLFELYKQIIRRQQLELVKDYIDRGMDQADRAAKFKDFAEAKGAIIDFEVDDISAKQKTRSDVLHFSHVVKLWGFDFSACVKFFGINSETRLAIYLKMKQPSENKQKWSCKVKGRLILKNSRSKDHSFPLENTFTSDNSVSDWGFHHILAMTNILDPRKGFIRDDKVQIAAVFLANKPKFSTDCGSIFG